MQTDSKRLTPPLKPPASHGAVPFIIGTPPSLLPDQTVAAIAAALYALLPPEDLAEAHTGVMIAPSASPGVWPVAARLEAVSRSIR